MKGILLYLALFISLITRAQDKIFKDLSGRIDDNKAYISWRTDSALNGSILLERATPDKGFTEVSRVDLDNQDENDRYVSVDVNPPKGALKYRFKLVTGNSSQTSDTISIFNPKEEIRNSVSFVGKRINIFLTGVEENEIDIRIRNILGKEVFHRTIVREPSESSVYAIDEIFPSGIYFLQVMSSNKIYLRQKFSID